MVPRVGQKAPDFALPDTEKRERNLGEFIEGGAVLLAFFPFAFSGVCDKEMCAFRDGFGGFSESGAQVVGISVDSVFALKAFAQTYNLRFPLLSDFNKKAATAYGVIQDPWVGFSYRGVAKQSVFLVDKRKILRYKWITENPGVEPPYADVARAAERLKG